MPSVFICGPSGGLRIGAAVVHEVRIRRLDLGQNRLEVDGLVVREFAIDDRRARCLRRLLELVGKTLAVCRTVVDDRNLLHLQRLDRELTGDRTLLRIGRHHAERGLVTLRRVLRRGRHRDLGNAGVRVDARSGNGRARVEVTEHALHVVVHQLLSDGRTRTRVGLVVG